MADTRRRRAARLLVLLAALAALPLVIRFLTHAMLFHPVAGERFTPADVGLEFERVGLTAADGTELTAWWVPGPAPGPTVLFFHGNAGNLSDRVGRLLRMHEEGLSVLALDYRGYGLSQGRVSEEGTALDARAAWDHLVGARGLPPDEIALFGSSLGAAVALRLASEVGPPAVVLLEAPFLSVRAMAREVLPVVPGFLVPDLFDNAALAPRVAAPVTIWHGTADAVVPFSHGRRLAGLPGWDARLVEVGGGDHACIDSSDLYAELAAAARGR